MKIDDLLLRRRGIVFSEQGKDRLDPSLIQAVELNLAQLGYALSHKLQERLCSLPSQELAKIQEQVFKTLAAGLGADQKHEPLFRRFPDGIPQNTFELWLQKVACHFFQADDQPCLFCQQRGTTHVLKPCGHVVCDLCFDGSNYSACPVCEHHVDRNSPFFQPTPEQNQQRLDFERVRFKLLGLGDDRDQEARKLFVSFCERKQALSPADKEDFVTLLQEYGEKVLTWLPPKIPVKENVAIVFGLLVKERGQAVLPIAARYFATATDVLRFIAVFSGADPGLLKTIVWKQFPSQSKGWEKFQDWLMAASGSSTGPGRSVPKTVAMHTSRFKVSKISRPMRRTLLGILEGLEFDHLMEDMLRYCSYWIWVGEFLHPFENAKRFPKVALAFSVIRETPLGDDSLGRVLRAAATNHPLLNKDESSFSFQTYYSRLETAVRERDTSRLTELLAQRPGELARKLDHGLRLALESKQPTNSIVEAFTTRISLMATPVLVALSSYLPRRRQPFPVRVFFPKTGVTTGVSVPDNRSSLPETTTGPLTEAIEHELLKRLSKKATFENSIIDGSLRAITVPFNERTASKAAVSLPRGSIVPVPAGKTMRLFLHWCQPPGDKNTTDIDLSVGFYRSDWQYAGVCSYYQLICKSPSGKELAKSAGDLRDGPPPNGATEFVDFDRSAALDEGIRYAVMVVTNYAGLPFSALERKYAGLMLRDDTRGAHFDPRTVELKFDLQGEHGVFLPLVVDLEKNVLHWLDAYSKGMFEFNNVETSNRAITKICPELIAYFGSGVRPSLYQLSVLHAAARSKTVYVRDGKIFKYQRKVDETPYEFYKRITNGDSSQAEVALPTLDSPLFAALYRGDIDLPQGSECYALFQDRQTSGIAASDLLSA